MTDNTQTQNELSFLEHLKELRNRLLRMVLVVFIAVLVLFPFAGDLFETLALPLIQQLPGGTLITVGIPDPFLVPFKVAVFVAILITVPYLLYELWAFIAPGLYKHERHLVFPLLLSSIILFYLGINFAYFLVLPLVFSFFIGIAPGGVEVMPDIGKYLDFVTTLFLAFGFAFEVPVATIIIVATGITDPDKLSRARPYIVVAAFTVGMLFTPPDVISQIMLAIPVWILFELGLIMSRILVKKRPEEYDGIPDDLEEEFTKAEEEEKNNLLK